MAAGDHNETNESTAHVDFDGGSFGFGLVPGLSLLCSGFLGGGGSGEAVLKRIGKDNVALLELTVHQHGRINKSLRACLEEALSIFDHSHGHDHAVVAYRISTLEEADKHAAIGGVNTQGPTQQAVQILDCLLAVHCRRR